MRFPLDFPGQRVELQTRIFGTPQLLLNGQPAPQANGVYQVPKADGGTIDVRLVYSRDPFIPALETEGEVKEVVTRSPVALGLSILPLVLGAALGANLGDRLGGFAILVLGVLCGSIVGYFFQKAVYHVLRSPNHPFARVLITVGLYLALLMFAVFTSAILALLFPEKMAA